MKIEAKDGSKDSVKDAKPVPSLVLKIPKRILRTSIEMSLDRAQSLKGLEKEKSGSLTADPHDDEQLRGIRPGDMLGMIERRTKPDNPVRILHKIVPLFSTVRPRISTGLSRESRSYNNTRVEAKEMSSMSTTGGPWLRKTLLRSRPVTSEEAEGVKAKCRSFRF